MNTCPNCGKQIRRRSKQCKQCCLAERNRSPEMRAASSRNMTVRCAAGIRRNPAAVAAALREYYKDPVNHAKLVDRSRSARSKLNAEHFAKWSAGGVAGRLAKLEARLAWCPADRRDELQALKIRLGAAEGERVMREDLEAAERRRIAAMTPFERQMERVRNGAKLVEKFVPRRADHDFTLGGVAPVAI